MSRAWAFPLLAALCGSLALAASEEGPEGRKDEETSMASKTAGSDGKQTRSLAETEGLVRAQLAERLKIPEEGITIVSSRERTWTDADLGCAPRRGLAESAPMVVPGYEVVVRSAARTFTYHTDRSGTVRPCGGSSRKPLDPIR